jgi:hypothetical protein
MNHPFAILAIDPGTVIFFVFAVISFISWIANQANAAKKVPPPRNPNPQAPAQRNPQVQREIERFLREAAAKQRGQMVEADEIEVVRPESARRPPPKRKVVEKPRPAAARGLSSAKPQGLAGPARPGEGLAARHLAPKAQSSVANEHLPQSKAAVPLPDDVSKSVSAHLGVFAAGGTAAAAPAGAPRRRAANSFLKELRTPQGMRSAIVMQEILKRPRALRAIQRKPAG